MRVWQMGQRPPRRADWEAVKVEAMYLANRAKLEQNPALLAPLLASDGPITHMGSGRFWDEWNPVLLELLREELGQRGGGERAVELRARFDGYRVRRGAESLAGRHALCCEGGLAGGRGGRPPPVAARVALVRRRSGEQRAAAGALAAKVMGDATDVDAPRHAEDDQNHSCSLPMPKQSASSMAENKEPPWPQLAPLAARLRLAKMRPGVDARIDLARARSRHDGSARPSRFPGEPPIFVGSVGHAKDVEALVELGVGAVLNCAPSVCKDPRRKYEAAGIAYAEVEASDDKTFPLLQRCLPPATAFLDAQRGAGGGGSGSGVLVHCMAGSNRSATLAAAHIMLRDRRELLELFPECVAARPSILQNVAFQLQLCELAAENGLLHEPC
jgi:hypothetical protein